GGGGFGELAGVGDERRAAAHLLKNTLCRVAHGGFVLGGGGEENLADAEFFLPLGGFEALDDGLDLFIADGDERRNAAAQQARPCHFGLDLGLQGVGRGAAGLEVLGEFFRRLAEVLGDAGEGGIHLGVVHDHVVGLGL